MSPEPKLSKAERLAIGTAVAGPVRQQARAPRKVTLVGKDGAPVGVTDSVEVAKSLLARSEIEFSVQEGKRVALQKCARFGTPFPRARKGVRHYCIKCQHPPCTDCGGATGGRGRGQHVREAPRCRPCFYKAHVGRLLEASAKGVDARRRKAVEKAATGRSSEEQSIAEAMNKAKSIRGAAKLLGMDPSNLRRRIRRLGIAAAKEPA